jgi:hypothetical protein
VIDASIRMKQGEWSVPKLFPLSQREKNALSSAIRDSLVQRIREYNAAYATNPGGTNTQHRYHRLVGAVRLAKDIGEATDIKAGHLYQEAIRVAKKVDEDARIKNGLPADLSNIGMPGQSRYPLLPSLF